MFKFISKLFSKPTKKKSLRQQSNHPCWRCLQLFPYGVKHNCQHGYDCVMLGWRCLRCRILCGMRRGVCYTFKCAGGDCVHLKEAAKLISEGKEPFDGFDRFR